MILGLDISTSIIGATVISQEGEILSTFAWDMRNKNHFPDNFTKYNHIQGELLDIEREYNIKHIFIEQSLQMFRSGFLLPLPEKLVALRYPREQKQKKRLLDIYLKTRASLR